MKNKSGAVTLMALMLGAGAAHAVPITFSTVGDTHSLDFNGLIDGDPVEGLSAQLILELTEISALDFTFDVTLSNTTDGDLWESARISGFGFNVNPNVDSASADGGWTALYSAPPPLSLPNFGAVDICLTQQPPSCQGGGGGGVTLGGEDTFSLTLTFASLTSSVDLWNFAVRYQSLDSDALGISGDSGIGVPTQVPSPGPLALLGAGLIGLAMLRRRQVGARRNSTVSA